LGRNFGRSLQIAEAHGRSAVSVVMTVHKLTAGEGYTLLGSLADGYREQYQLGHLQCEDLGQTPLPRTARRAAESRGVVGFEG
jgi:hypothetical protein